MNMASGTNTHPAQLSESQLEALQQYTQFTHQEVRDAILLLERSQWNVQIAITKFFDGEGPDPVAAVLAQADIRRTAGRQEMLQESFHTSHRTPSAHRTEPAPRVVPRPAYQPPWMIGLFMLPFQLGWSAVTRLFNYGYYILSFLPQSLRPNVVSNTIARGLGSTSGRKMLLPRDSAARFRREFEEEYGSSPLPWFEGGFAQAQDLAKKELKFLLAILMSPEHDDTASFVRNVLLDHEVVRFLTDPGSNIMLWGGNVLDSEAYMVSNEYKCTKFPFSVLISLTPKEGSSRMGIIKRLIGPMLAPTYLAGIRAAIAKYAPEMEVLRAERVAQQTTRNLRIEQDSAYERSLAQDRQRVRQRREAEQAAAEARKRAQDDSERAAERESQRQIWRRWRATTIAPEPPASDRDAVRLAVKMPEGTGAGRVIRRFAGDTMLEELFAFVECYDLLQKPSDESELDEESNEGGPMGYEHVYSFQLASVMPREVFTPSREKTLREAIGRSGNLVVEDIADEDKGEGEKA